MKIQFYNTIKTQIELLPRITIVYYQGIGIEWLWFGLYIKFKLKIMRILTDFFVSPKYRKLHDVIFRIFVISVLGTGLLWFFFDWLILPQIVAILFVVYEIPNMFFHWIAFYREK